MAWSKENILHDLIDARHWDEAEGVLVGKADLPVELSQMVMEPNGHGNLPLHMTMYKGAPEGFILSLIEADKRAVKVKGSGMWLPLHYAAANSRSSPKVIEALIRVYPQALNELNHKGSTPRDVMHADLDVRAKAALMKPSEL
eukprot:CAMPEP_0195529136 /NCGR_PEP_ID=MMETSP0794_2-20130614/31561_1 /TAXON_ID=515487 /ORGANISM="Stephanopyxis turris, Strain CCMP 815" /LENGTH=142 /DNA_ID=CAMNT_0040660391 /DNA_START=232 /DNA_END=660 /DNA_ORIENTATION=-